MAMYKGIYAAVKASSWSKVINVSNISSKSSVRSVSSIGSVDSVSSLWDNSTSISDGIFLRLTFTAQQLYTNEKWGSERKVFSVHYSFACNFLFTFIPFVAS